MFFRQTVERSFVEHQDIFVHDFSYSRLMFSSKVVHRDWELLCIPDLPVGRHQDWLARVHLTTHVSSGKSVTDVHQYRYVTESFTWILDDECQFDQDWLGKRRVACPFE